MADSFLVAGVDVGAQRMECTVALVAAQRATHFSHARAVHVSTPGHPDSLDRAWFELLGVDPTPPVGTPGAFDLGGNSTPARALVAGVRKSPVFGPVSGE